MENKKHVSAVAIVFFLLVLLGIFTSLGRASKAPVVQMKTNAAASATSSEALPDADYRQIPLTIGSMSFTALVADTDPLRELGLSGREGLLPREVMLFAFDKSGTYGFWMKDMKFSIDIVWLGADKRVITVEKRLSPETYPKVFYPASSARYVLELPAGAADAFGVRPGDAASFSL